MGIRVPSSSSSTTGQAIGAVDLSGNAAVHRARILVHRTCGPTFTVIVTPHPCTFKGIRGSDSLREGLLAGVDSAIVGMALSSDSDWHNELMRYLSYPRGIYRNVQASDGYEEWEGCQCYHGCTC